MCLIKFIRVIYVLHGNLSAFLSLFSLKREKAGCLGSFWLNAPWEWYPCERVFWWEKKLYPSVQQQLKLTSFNNKLSLPDVLICITDSH